MIIMTHSQKELIDSVLDENKFWIDGLQEACFKEDVKAMMLVLIKKLELKEASEK